MKQDLDARHSLVRDSGNGRSDAEDAIAPILATVAGDEQAWGLGCMGAAELTANRENGIYPAVSGNVNFSLGPFPAQICRAELGGGEEQRGNPIDRNAELFFRPGTAKIVASKARFHMGDGDAAEIRGKRSAERASSVALDDHHARTLDAQLPRQGLADRSDISMRIVLTGAAQVNGGIAAKTIFRRIEGWMLARKDEGRSQPLLGKSSGDGCNLDGFGPGADNDTNATGQLSPWLGAARVALESAQLNGNYRRMPGF